MTKQNPPNAGRPRGQAVDDEDPDYSPMTDKPKAPERDGVAKTIKEDNERIQKGAP